MEEQAGGSDTVAEAEFVWRGIEYITFMLIEEMESRAEYEEKTVREDDPGREVLIENREDLGDASCEGTPGLGQAMSGSLEKEEEENVSSCAKPEEDESMGHIWEAVKENEKEEVRLDDAKLEGYERDPGLERKTIGIREDLGEEK